MSVLVIDDDADLAASVARLLRRNGHAAEPFSDPALFLAAYAPGAVTCIVSDIMLGSHDGFELAREIRRRDPAAAFVFMTAWPSAAHAVDAVRRHGGFDYLEKPVDEERLLAAVAEGLSWSRERGGALSKLELLSRRERQVFELLARGMSNKAVAARLELSPKTVEDHRAAVMAKTGADNLADLIALDHAARDGATEPGPLPGSRD